MTITPMPDDKNVVIEVFNNLSTDMQTVLKEAQKDIQSIKSLTETDPLWGYKMYLILFLCKGIEICQSVLTILKVDLTLWRTANANLRSLLELCINARYMKKDPENLAIRFARFDCVRRYKFKQKISDLGDETKAMLDSNVAESERLDQEYAKYKEDYTSINSWHGLSDKELLEAIKEETEDTWLYALIYSFQSRHLHNETASLEEYLREADPGFEICRTVTAEDIDRSLVTGIVFFAMLYQVFSGAFELGRDNWIQNFMKKFKEKRV
jgi:hypothetical protein